MKKYVFTLACSSALALASTAAFAQQMDPNMPGMAGMQAAKPTQAQGVGIVKAIDTAKGTITLQHQAIAAIGWPAMTMTFKADPPALLQKVKVGEQVKFTLHPAGMASTVTAISPAG
ncbi:MULTISPECIES: copper-binding protein [Rhodanobacteraceae]|jgi:Cu/Ag efflux protein CusF|uniref:Cu(I)/Ag(I) efflux system protein CusF n=1 Tax=Rhodanobacter glycinis TaxID=582702 RepID=A0A1I3YCT2_9GAMM|nr:copper-binding protein [Rhodanobacter glycinis]SFK29615.1 Cu(I)/Ag(I) efflux system protein CusF [Rhodanobacter glycinis]